MGSGMDELPQFPILKKNKIIIIIIKYFELLYLNKEINVNKCIAYEDIDDQSC
jgi:hypothetical protein